MIESSREIIHDSDVTLKVILPQVHVGIYIYLLVSMA